MPILDGYNSPMMNLLLPFCDPRVRDLAWVMAAPGLIRSAETDFAIADDWRRNALARAMPQLLALDRHPAPLHDWIAAHHPQRLGRYFETLLKYWLQHLMAGELVAANLPVKTGNVVMGEYDFLWRDAAGVLHHWEAAVKFYLQIDAAAGLAGYVGTLTRDRLDVKFIHLRDKQLQLSATPAGAAALPRVGDSVHARALFTGWLFYPHGQTMIRSPEISPQHLHGWWIRWNASAFNAPPGLQWAVLKRQEWLAPCIRQSREELQTETELRALLETCFSTDATPLLVAGLTRIGNFWHEVTRGFIVSPEWNLHPDLPFRRR